ncbi:hypothetical protein [Candidatus Oleimmundimicrobium sp.]|uniref:hypothetical protein n=1 Tax=Candidatus Oleimmundimicrobium sp. TaxID=3060597 RepID=UPI002719E372|nr:hypothetical protein [Candidatus Oleimmundimicrobium sp.]MDO8886509.1 hypothetical protein [Candidatus Oleimmundimicrobium sp.]
MGKNRFMEVFDVLFIMILCFTTLLTTMLMRGKVLVGSGSGGGMTYTFSAGTFLLTFLSLGTYLAIVIPQSNRELGEIVEGLYEAEKAEPGAGTSLEPAPAGNPR